MGRWAGIAVSMCASLTGVFAQDTQTIGNDLFYYDQGQRISLVLSSDKIGVKLEEGASISYTVASLQANPRIGAFDDGSTLHKAGKQWAVVALTPNASPEETLLALAQVDAAPGIAKAVPIVKRHGWAEGMPTDLFYVSLSSSADEGALDAMNQSLDVEVVERSDLSVIGKIGYWLRVAGDSTLNAISAANHYYESGLVLEASPSFAHLYDVRCSITPNDSYYASKQWNLQRIQCPAAWDITTGSPDIVIAILDTGVDYTHEDLTGKILRSDGQVVGYDFVDGDADPFPAADFWEGGERASTWHGTSMASIAAASTNNGIGTAGVAWNCKIMPVRIMNGAALNRDDPWGDEAFDLYAARGIFWAAGLPVSGVPAAARAANVLSISWATVFPNGGLRDAVAAARAVGCVVVTGSGNRGYDITLNEEYPGSYPEAVTVGAVNKDDDRCDALDWPDPSAFRDGSNYGAFVDIVAPSTSRRWLDSFGWPIWGIWVADIHDIPGYMGAVVGDYQGGAGGTSAATPHVAGAAALLLSYDSTLTPTQVQACLLFGATDGVGRTGEDTAGRDVYMGHGRLDVRRALELAGARNSQVRLTTGRNLMLIDNEGNLVAEGRIFPSSTSTVLNAETTSSFVYRNSSGDIKARVDSNGNVYLAGTLEDRVTSLTAPPGAAEDTLLSKVLYYRFPGGSRTVPWAVIGYDASVVPVQTYCAGYIDASGNLRLRGRAFQGGNPDPVTWLVRDDFEDEDHAGWQVWGGTWGVEDTEWPSHIFALRKLGLTATANIATPVAASDYRIHLSWRRVSGTGGAAVNLRQHTNTSRWVQVSIGANGLALDQHDNGTWTRLGEYQGAGIQNDVWYDLNAECVGGTIRVYHGPDPMLNGIPLTTPVMTTTTCSILNANFVNIWVDGTAGSPTQYEFDNVKVYTAPY